MIRARGLLLGGASLATLAGFTIALSSAGAVPGVATARSLRVPSSADPTHVAVTAALPASRTAVVNGARTLAFVGSASASGRPQQRLNAYAPLLPSQEVDTVSPNAGASGPGGEQAVVITGSGFTGATDVFFGSIDVNNSTGYPCLPAAAGCFNVVDDTEIDADTPEAPPGTGTVDVTVDTGSANGPADDYSYFDPPTVTSVDSPQDQGATGIAVAGTNYSYPGVTPLTSGVSEVDLNPTAAGSTIPITTTCASGSSPNCFTFEDDSDLTVNLPNSVPAGTYDVQVITPGGTSATSVNDRLVVEPPGPTLTTVAPSAGTTAGGTSVNLTGTGFTTATDVFFGAVDVTSFTINSNTSITVSSPAHAAGQVNVTVENPGGTSGSQPYTFVAPPTLTTVAPPAGTTAGGTTVNLTGTNFNTATDVFFGAVDVTSFTINSNTSITVTSPAHAAGQVSVTVENPGGTSGSQPFTFAAPPTLTTVAPPSGSTAGGTAVNLTGTNFNTATDVFFGAVDVTSFTINSNTSITVTSPAHAAGQVSVAVENPGGTSGSQPYTYVAPPTLTTVAPPAGTTAGGTTVNLTGTNFTTATDVFFGADDVTSFTVNSNTSITVGSPAHAAGQVSVTVQNPGGTSGSQPYTFVAAPTLTTVAPSAGKAAGGTTVNLTGTNFTTATDVFFGADDVTSFTINSNTSITVTSPAHAVGGVSVTVENPGGTSGSQPYTYDPVPALSSLAPPSGSTAGGNDVVLTGTGFTGATEVDFGGTAISACGSGSCFTVDSDTQITVNNIPGGSAGAVNVDVTTPGGTSGTQQYTYMGASLSNVNPPTGTTLGGNTVTLTGTFFTGATDVNVGSHDLTPCGTGACFTVVSDTEITVTMPANGPGAVDVDVVTPAGTTNDNLTYTYVTPAPTLTNLNPSSGSGSGGNTVSLTGTNLNGATDVNWGSVDINTVCGTGTCFTINSSTSITVDNVPPHLAGGVNVTVTTPGGMDQQTNTYTYLAPALTGLSPSSGPTAGGTSVTLTGTGFVGATDVNVGSNDLTQCPSAPCFTIDSDTQITVTMPSNPPGSVNVTVTTPGGITTAQQYTYIAPVPTVTNLSSNEGSPNGGNNFTLTGTGFAVGATPITSAVTITDATPVNITTTPCVAVPSAPCFTVNSPTSIFIGYMAAGSGQVNIEVTTPGGTSAAGAGNTYTYNTSAPNVTGISPRDGAISGGEAISVLGSGFGAVGQDFVTDVYFGTNDVQESNTYPCPSSSNGCFIVVGPNQLAVYTPANAAGTVDVMVKTPLGTTDTAVADKYTFVAPGAYTAVTPYRVCDTRPPGPGIAHNECNTGVGTNKTLPPGGSVTAQITTSTAGQVPMGAQAVVVNVTAIDHSAAPTYVTAYPAGGSPPLVSNINLSGGKVGTNLVIVQLSSGGAITLFNAAGTTDVIVDVEGYFATPPGGNAGQFHSIPPLRICDSRANQHTGCAGTTNNPLTAGHWHDVVLSGLPPGAAGGTQSIPATSAAAAAVFNLTAVGGTAPTTFLSVTPALAGNNCPTAAPAFSNLNPAEGTALPNRVISKLGPDQDVCIYSALGSINFIVDVNGWFGGTSGSPPPGVLFYSVPPTRVCDTRVASCSVPPGPLGLTPAESDPILIAGVQVVPADNVHSTAPVAVVANLTGVAGNATTFFTLYPSDATRPNASDLNPAVGAVIANLAIVEISTTTGSTDGDVSLYNAAGDINAIFDVAGWFQ
jgi:hypothetical protein